MEIVIGNGPLTLTINAYNTNRAKHLIMQPNQLVSSNHQNQHYSKGI